MTSCNGLCVMIHSLIVLLLPLLYVSVYAQSQCPAPWDRRPGESSCYLILDTQRLTLQNARQFCHHNGGFLVAINSKNEETYLAGRLAASPYTNFWVGVIVIVGGYGWMWDDGSPFSYFNWVPGQSDENGRFGDKVYINKTNMQWAVTRSESGIGTICEMKVDDNSTAIPHTTPQNQPGKFYGCEEGWVSYLDSCYLIMAEEKTWLDAQTTCRLRGAELTSISSHLENQFIWSHVPFGCQDKNSSCSELAQNGGCPEIATFTNVNCRKSCGLCDSACANRYTTIMCDYWTFVGECTKNPFWMWENCALSCGCDRDANEGYWIGLNDRITSMDFKWSDLSPVTYVHWMPKEPSHFQGKKEDCVLMHSATGEWSDEICGTPSSGFICEKPKTFMDQRTVDASALGCSFGSVGYTGKCFTTVSFVKTWTEAKAYCERFKSNLAILPDRKTNAFLTSVLFSDQTEANYWIGLSATGESYSWVDGSKPDFITWTSHHTGKEQDMCVSLTIKGWATVNCSSSLYFVCEKPRRGWATTTNTTTAVAGGDNNTVPCPPGWTGHNDYCYKLTSTPKKWIEAQNICEQQAGFLVTLHNQDTNDFLFKSVMKNSNTMGNDEVWIGLQGNTVNDDGAEYVWSDGRAFDFEAWDEGQPYSFTMLDVCAAVMKTSGKWKVSSCYELKPFVCQIKRGGLYVTLPPKEESTTVKRVLKPCVIPLCREKATGNVIDDKSIATPGGPDTDTTSTGKQGVSNVKKAPSTADHTSCSGRISTVGLVGVILSALCVCAALVMAAFVYGKKKGSPCKAASSNGFDNALYLASQGDEVSGGAGVQMDEINDV